MWKIVMTAFDRYQRVLMRILSSAMSEYIRNQEPGLRQTASFLR